MVRLFIVCPPGVTICLAVGTFDFKPANLASPGGKILLLDGFCLKHEIKFFDLLSAFRQAHAEGRCLYLYNHGHWNGERNQLAADLFFNYLYPHISRAIGEK